MSRVIYEETYWVIRAVSGGYFCGNDQLAGSRWGAEHKRSREMALALLWTLRDRYPNTAIKLIRVNRKVTRKDLQLGGVLSP